ncbi:galactose-binding domain-containing protein, partial [Clostridium perfringens]|uniref:galactose-binding domain-containing protein n=1 Tax=Clostridium perfringens TaxID=1502 RepID=UPI002ACC02C2
MSGTSVANYIRDNNKAATTLWQTRDPSKGVDITYDFGMVKSVDQMHVWNMNQMNNADRGLKNVKIEYSLDNENWQTLTPQDGLEYLDEKNEEYPVQLAKASGENGIKATNLNTENHE